MSLRVTFVEEARDSQNSETDQERKEESNMN